jgi:thiosulfate/3-mercaptopyruvate sulfurtransferase
LEAWEKVLLDTEAFSQTDHGLIGCLECHGGRNVPEKEQAHQGMVRDPSLDAQATCGRCHGDLPTHQVNSLHYTLLGYETALAGRSNPQDPETWAHIQEMRANHCSACHATCGQCHVSRPTSVGGGFLDGHIFLATPPMSRTCTACHGSRVEDEYLGKIEGLRGDVHFRQGRMACVDCHDAGEMHGEPANCQTCHPGPAMEEPMPLPEHRYAGVQTPRCEACHVTAATGMDGVEQHGVHGGKLACQVCHSLPYKNCDGCHTLKSEEGLPYFETRRTYVTFFIGRNPQPSYERPYEFVLVRHVPIDRDSFSVYGENLLPNYDALPTWRYATPHNIQLETPQTESCNACHGNADLFLTADKVDPAELRANEPVIIESVPEPVD